jgi:hypothetical protein
LAVEEIEKNLFKTVFPTKGEMNRMIEWGIVQTKDQKAKLFMEECGGGSNIKQVMSKVWVQMTRLPSELRDFLTIWAIDTILGVTKDVDMNFTRKYNRARLQVLSAGSIPHTIHYVRNTQPRCACMKNGDAQITHLRRHVSHYRVI